MYDCNATLKQRASFIQRGGDTCSYSSHRRLNFCGVEIGEKGNNMKSFDEKEKKKKNVVSCFLDTIGNYTRIVSVYKLRIEELLAE